MPTCPQCQGSIIEYNSAAGDGFCVQCGTVVEENAIVSEITFGETASGAAIAQGSYVAAGATRARMTGKYANKGIESREQVIENGRRRIAEVAHAMHLSERISVAAQRWFNCCINTNFIKGRRSQHVAAVCLYISCRFNKTSHMLIDFSDMLAINVFTLGATYLRAVTHLRIQLPLIDPAHYISRFCALLEFGDDTRKVADDAARLVQRFDRDWMRTGRRPSGICGACILLAARMNNFRRSVQEIVQVVKIADSTLKKRLEEFKSTPSGGLTVQDFRTMWLEEEANPPAFEDARDRDRRMKGLGEKGKKRGRSEVVDGENEEENEGVTVESEAATKRTKRDTVLPDISNVTPEGNVASTSRRPFEIEGTLLDEDALGSPDASFHFTDALLDNLPPTTPANEDEEAIAAEVSQYLQSSEDAAISITMPPPVQPPAPTMSTSTSTNGTTDDWTAGIDDEELDMYLLDEVEVQKKTRMWVEFNKEYLEKIAARGIQLEQAQSTPVKKKRAKSNKPRDASTPFGETTSSSATNFLKSKRSFSKKINYGQMDRLFDGDTPGMQRFRRQKEQEMRMRGLEGLESMAPDDDAEVDEAETNVNPNIRKDVVTRAEDDFYEDTYQVGEGEDLYQEEI